MKLGLILVALLLLGLALGTGGYLYSKQPVRVGSLPVMGLQAEVKVRYDERGVPHIEAANELDMYRAMGYLHAQDRLFQMEMLRRLSRGELAEVFGPRLLDSDRLFRSLRIRDAAAAYVARQNKDAPAWKALQAYLAGVNAYQESGPRPLEFDLLGITPRPFSAEDTFSISGYMAYSFAAAFRTEPVLTFVRDNLGTEYLKIFQLEGLAKAPTTRLATGDWQDLGRLAQISQSALAEAGLADFEGSNAWVIAGRRTRSGKPLLAGDPHVRFAAPAVWYEMHAKSPGFELYGHFQALNPFAFLGHNSQFGWSLTMFQNDDVDLVAEKPNPENADQIWYRGQWVELQREEQEIAVKDQAPVSIVLRTSPHGPVINDALGSAAGETPIALWWAFLQTPNPVLDAFYQLNRADTLEKARSAATKIHAPGLNVVWANAKGDIAWWAAAQLPIWPEGVSSFFLLDGSTAQADKQGYYPFSDNPQEENPVRGYIISANGQPANRRAVPGYYNPPERTERLNARLADNRVKWDLQNTQSLQLDTTTEYGPRILKALLPLLREVAASAEEHGLVEQLANWQGDYPLHSVPATLFSQLLYQIAEGALADDLGEVFFSNLLQTRILDSALPRLVATDDSPWWDKSHTNQKESRREIIQAAWQASLQHLRKTLGEDSTQWQWGNAHTLTQNHPLGQQKPLDALFNVGPFAVPGSHEVPNNLSARVSSAPWRVVSGPSTRRLIDFADPAHSLGINPLGQSAVLFDAHYADQTEAYISGHYYVQRYEEAEIKANSRGLLKLLPVGL